MKCRKIIVMFFLALCAAWLGLPALNMWQADALVDDLCSKDGGVKVYEIVIVSDEEFNRLIRMSIKFKKYSGKDDEYFFSYLTEDIRGDSNSKDILSLVIFKTQMGVVRRKDDKLLGSITHYGRRGGNPIGPWHPSSYSCPLNSNEGELVRRVFVKKSTNSRG